MGPGYFPLVLAVVLVLFGALILFNAIKAGKDSPSIGAIAWRGLLFILPAPIFFGLVATFPQPQNLRVDLHVLAPSYERQRIHSPRCVPGQGAPVHA
jgi:hypothetical protein